MSCHHESRWAWGQRFASVVAVLLGLLVAGYGALASYGTITDLAVRKGLALPELVPVGVDGGLLGVMVLEIVLTWTGQPLGWLRQVVRLFTIGTVVANAAAGWPDAVAIGLHIAAPVMLLTMLEAARTVLLRRIGIAAGTARESIPLARWLLAPWPTWLLWRRMVLWQITSYHGAIELEHSLRYATTLLRGRHGRRWRRDAPAEVVWRLTNALTAEEAHAAVCQVNETAEEESSPRVVAGSWLISEVDDFAGRSNAEQSKHPVARVSGPSRSSTADMITGRPEWPKAVRFNEQHWARYGRPASIEKLRVHLGVGATRARALARAVRDRDRDVVCRSSPIIDMLTQ